MYSLFRQTGSDLGGSAMKHRSKHLRNIAVAVAVIVIGGAAAAPWEWRRCCFRSTGCFGVEKRARACLRRGRKLGLRSYSEE